MNMIEDGLSKVSVVPVLGIVSGSVKVAMGLSRLPQL